MCDINWLEHIPVDIFRIIISQCSEGDVMMITFTSVGMWGKIPANYFSPRFNPCNHGAICGSQGIIDYSILRGFKCTGTTLNLAASHGHPNVIKYLLATKCPSNSDICSEAVYSGKTCVLQLLNESGFELNQSTMATAAKIGNLDMMRWLKDMGCPWNTTGYYNSCLKNTGYIAALGGHINVLEWLQENRFPLDRAVCFAAVKSGNTEVLEWAWANNNYYDLTTDAARYGHIDVLKWFHAKGQHLNPLDEFACRRAASVGRLDTLQWLYQNGHSINVNICEDAASYGHLHILKWLHENGCQWNASVYNMAIQSGQLDVLQWLHENGCPWNANACSLAVRARRMDILKWLHENGCPWDTYTFSYAASFGDLGTLKWLLENGCPWDVSAYNFAIVNGYFEVLKWLHENGCPWDASACKTAVFSNDILTLKWLHENGCPWDASICACAVRDNRFKILVWVYNNGCEINMQECYILAKKGNYHTIIEWLEKQL